MNNIKDIVLKTTGMTSREFDIISMKYGLDGGKKHTLEEVSKQFGVTRERIRQICAKSLEKTRHFITGDSDLAKWTRKALELKNQ